jgi:large subunit ribosomal protein L24
MLARVKKNDTVIVLSGRDKGEEGTVLEVLPTLGKVKVKGLRMATKHLKATKQGESGGIKKVETYLNLSQVMPVCASCKKGCRIVAKESGNGKKVRACHRCEEII